MTRRVNECSAPRMIGKHWAEAVVYRSSLTLGRGLDTLGHQRLSIPLSVRKSISILFIAWLAWLKSSTAFATRVRLVMLMHFDSPRQLSVG